MSSRTSSTAATSSTLRPRVPRLISGLDDVVTDTSGAGVRQASPLPSPFDSREPSPMPSRRLPRTGPPHPHPHPQSIRNAKSVNGLRPDRGQSPATLSGFFGDSWSALQGMASELLTPSPVNTTTTAKTPWSSHSRKSSLNAPGSRNTSAPPRQWGNVAGPAPSVIGVGSKQERDALVRAEKRKELMNATPQHLPDTLGRFKRRSSEDGPSASAPPEHGHDRDALVYVHNVHPGDTLPGITIKYNIHPSALRRANRMWPNDGIQARKTILLPVDQCAVKGTRLNGSEDLYQLTQENNPFPTSIEEIKTPIPTARKRNESISTNSDRPTSSSCQSALDTEPTWLHDSWVLMPNSKQPTEIARLSRRNLAYFPPARRKSVSYSDIDSPSTSMDIARSVIHEHPLHSPSKQDTPQRPRRARKTSNATNGYFPSYLAGPGGVGTMGKNVKSPGPAQDGLNKMFASHLPNVAPPPNQSNLYLPDIPTYSDEPAPFTPGLTHAQTPTLNIEHVGGAIEGWVRKIAAKASTALDTPPDRQTPGRSGGGVGDLIEMAESFEIGGDDEDEEDHRGRQGSTSDVQNGRSVGSGTSYAYASTVKERPRSGVSAGIGKRSKDD